MGNVTKPSSTGKEMKYDIIITKEQYFELTKDGNIGTVIFELERINQEELTFVTLSYSDNSRI